MNKTYKKILSFIIFFSSALCVQFGFSQPGSEAGNLHKGFYLGALYSSISGPTFRFPSGSSELYVPQTTSTPGFMVGYEYNLTSFGFGLRVLYWHAAFKDFRSPDMPGAPVPVSEYVSYSSPKFTHISVDLLLQWFPVKKGYLGVYGLLGLASSTEAYTISGSVFPEWNGQKSLSEFDYSYGLGIRISPVKLISFYGELRWIPGDTTTEAGDFLYSDGIYDYYSVKDVYTANYTKIFSFGISFNF
jgi:hypothetical protein